jgi:hypothetical protein
VRPARKQVAVFTGGFGALMYTSRNTDVIEPDSDGAVYKKSLALVGEVSEDMEAMFRGGAGSPCQVLKEHLEKGA